MWSFCLYMDYNFIKREEYQIRVKADLEKEVSFMASTILILTVVLLAIASAPLIGSMNRYKLHRTDLMAGDEGED